MALGVRAERRAFEDPAVGNHRLRSADSLACKSIAPTTARMLQSSATLRRTGRFIVVARTLRQPSGAAGSTRGGASFGRRSKATTDFESRRYQGAVPWSTKHHRQSLLWPRS